MGKLMQAAYAASCRLSSSVRDVRILLGWEVASKPNPKRIRAKLINDGLTLRREYPLMDGSYYVKDHTYPDAEMALAGYQRFLREVADQLPGSSKRQHLQAIRLNKELFKASNLNWKVTEEPDYGLENLR